MIQHELTSMGQQLWVDQSQAQAAARQFFPQSNPIESTGRHDAMGHAGQTIAQEDQGDSVCLFFLPASTNLIDYEPTPLDRQ